jgi:hypothetical protein
MVHIEMLAAAFKVVVKKVIAPFVGSTCKAAGFFYARISCR